MAVDGSKVPVGPGQQEKIGFGKSTREPEQPGLYYHRKAKKYVHVQHYAAADAVVRMGFELVEPGVRLSKSGREKLEANIARDLADRQRELALEGGEVPDAPDSRPEEEETAEPDSAEDQSSSKKKG